MVTTRLYYMDNLRALAMLAGVFFHAALAYSPKLQALWPAANTEQSLLLDWFSWFSHLFRMPLFFLIAGFFVAYLVARRGVVGMLKNRALRILLPFIIFLPLCMVATFIPLLTATNEVENKSAIMLMILEAMQNSDAPRPPPTTMHLWFLYNLIYFCVLVWLLRIVNWQWASNFLARLTPGLFLLIIPLVLLPGALLIASPKPAPESFIPQLWSFGFFGLFFVLGYWIFTQENFIARFNVYAFRILLASTALFALYYYHLPVQMDLMAPPLALWKKLLLAVCEVYIALWMTLVCLIYARQFLDSHHRWMRLIADSSYWIYIIHLPIIFALQYPLMDKNWGVWAEYGLTLAATFAVGMASYLVLVRWTPIGWMLNGRR